MFGKEKKRSPFELRSLSFPGEEEALVTVRIDAYPERIQSGVSSNIGNRSYQQDATMVENDFAYTDTSQMIAILCDGMGGLAGGEIASYLCASTLYEAFHSADIGDDVAAFLRTAICKLDQKVFELQDQNHKPLKAGTTLACIIIVEDKLYWASVGDSRIYLIRDNEIAQITEDHNYGMLLKKKVKQGIITPEQAQSHPKKEFLISYIGMGGIKYIDMNPNPFQLIDKDTILICSDGLYRCLSNDEMKAIVKSTTGSMDDVANALVSHALSKRKANQDNTTAVLVKYMDSG